VKKRKRGSSHGNDDGHDTSTRRFKGTPLSARLSTPLVWGIVLIRTLRARIPRVRGPIRSATAFGSRGNLPTMFAAVSRSDFSRAPPFNTLIFLVVRHQSENAGSAVFCPDSSRRPASGIRWLSVIFILPWAVPSIPTIPVGALHAQSRMGHGQSAHLQIHRR